MSIDRGRRYNLTCFQRELSKAYSLCHSFNNIASSRHLSLRICNVTEAISTQMINNFELEMSYNFSRHKLLLVHIPKSGGTAVKKALKKHFNFRVVDLRPKNLTDLTRKLSKKPRRKLELLDYHMNVHTNVADLLGAIHQAKTMKRTHGFWVTMTLRHPIMYTISLFRWHLRSVLTRFNTRGNYNVCKQNSLATFMHILHQEPLIYWNPQLTALANWRQAGTDRFADSDELVQFLPSLQNFLSSTDMVLSVDAHISFSSLLRCALEHDCRLQNFDIPISNHNDGRARVSLTPDGKALWYTNTSIRRELCPSLDRILLRRVSCELQLWQDMNNGIEKLQTNLKRTTF